MLALSDADVEAAAAADPDWQDVDPDWVEQAVPVHPVRKRRLTLALDEDVIDWFRSQDRHYRARERNPPPRHGTASRVRLAPRQGWGGDGDSGPDRSLPPPAIPCRSDRQSASGGVRASTISRAAAAGTCWQDIDPDLIEKVEPVRPSRHAARGRTVELISGPTRSRASSSS